MERKYSESEVDSIAREILSGIVIDNDKATILGFSGDLGAGKTTLVQSISKELGVEENVVSPTFVIAKWYKTDSKDFDTLVHIDAYRIESDLELAPLGFGELIKQKNTLIIIEWPEKIKQALKETNIQIFNIIHEGEDRKITGPFPYEK